jgi:hypothetical protein
MKIPQVLALLGVLVAFIVVKPVLAADDAPTWEWTGNSAASYTHLNYAGQGAHGWNVGFGGNYFLNNALEVGSKVNFSDTSAFGYETRTLGITVGPTFNFLGTPENAFSLLRKPVFC